MRGMVSSETTPHVHLALDTSSYVTIARGVGRGLKVRGQKIRARRENLINIHNYFVPENGRIRACAAEQCSILTQLGPIFVS